MVKSSFTNAFNNLLPFRHYASRWHILPGVRVVSCWKVQPHYLPPQPSRHRGAERKWRLRGGWVKAEMCETDRQTERQRDSETGHALQLPHSFKMHQALLYFPTTQPPPPLWRQTRLVRGRVGSSSVFVRCSLYLQLQISKDNMSQDA